MRNIVLLVLDALRFDHVTPEITPNLMEIAKKGVFYNNANSVNTATVKAIPGILCSAQSYSADNSIATVLKQSGYTTASFHSSPLVGKNFQAGFDVFIDLHSQRGIRDRDVRKAVRKYIPEEPLKIIKGVYRKFMDKEDYLPYMRARQVLEVAASWMSLTEHPWFIWIHLMDPHQPYYPQNDFGISRDEMIKLNDKLIEAAYRKYKPTFEEVSILKKLYQQEVMEMDAAIGKWAKNLKDEFLIITADHGEEFGEYGDFSHHEDKFIPPLQHVPLIIYGGDEKNIIKNDVSHLDISRIIFENLGINKKIGVWGD